MQRKEMFFAKTTLPGSNMTVGRVFAVKEINPDGTISAFLLMRTPPDEAANEYYVAIRRDAENLLQSDTCIDTTTEFIFPPDWKMIVRKGKLTDENYQLMIDRHEAYNSAHNPQKHIVHRVDAAMQKDALKDMYEEIKSSYRQDPEKIKEYLLFRSKFYQYSPRNSLLIMAQNPYASFVASYTRFKQMGYRIKPDEYAKPIQILGGAKTECIKSNGKLIDIREASKEEQIRAERGEIPIIEIMRYYPCYVYDISQTNCPASDLPQVLSMGKSSVPHGLFYQTMKQLSMDAGIPVEERELRSITLHGYYDIENNSITINSRLDDTAKATVIVHEFAHGLLHRTSNDPSEIKEFEAQAVALTIFYKYDFDLEENETRYLVRYFSQAQERDEFDLDKSLTRISRQVDFIEKNLSEREPQFLLENQHDRKPAEQPEHHVSSADILENFMQDL